MKTRVAPIAAVLALFLGAADPSAAQTATGQITGAITDATGATVTGVRIKITNTLTGLTRETTSSDRGTYSVPQLPVGTYVITAEKDGFKLAVSSANELKVDQVLRTDMTMELGALTESVEVLGRSVALDTETASIGQVITERQVTELPLNGRNFLQLLFLGNGAVETTGEQGTMRQGAGNAISINGSRPTSNNFLLDGTSNTDTSLGTPAAILSVDAIQEFKEQTATYSAEYRLQREPDQHRQQDRDEQAERGALLLPEERRARRPELLRRREAEARSEAVRIRHRRPGAGARGIRRA